MAIFKCKMCGGTLEINNNESVAECEYCGTQQTLPNLNDERKANLYDRANHFRRNNEFDKAEGIYEQILNEDNTDAEAYWSLVLCRYGIEYVEDPATHKRVPTVNRAQFTSVFDDDNYKSALQYADISQKVIYEKEANTINEIQKGILAISQKEEPFDVFICYKETDNNGRRTPDSVLANDLYHQLTQEGFKVFFSRITLEDKLGSAYEPYIFAALNSARVMVVLGTKPEYFKAVWVRNEWSRYLSLIKQGQNKMLIPAYKDMDPYDLPEEFSHLQAQDMSKLGFMQDLIRGIKKITGAEKSNAIVMKETVVASGNSNTDSLLKRVFMFLEDGDWNSADEYCEKVLDIDPENANAYLGKLMSELKVRKQKFLELQAEPFDCSNNYQKALRFAGENLKVELISYIEHINIRNENDRLDSIYTRAKNVMSVARDEKTFKEAANLFKSIDEYQDSDSLAQTCREKAEEARKDAILANGRGKMYFESISDCEAAIKLFESISGWKDADERILVCQRKIEELKAKEETKRLERERITEFELKEAERIKKRNKKIAIITTPIACAFIIFVIILNAVIIPNQKYNNAIALLEAGEYAEAISAFEALGGYKDSVEKITACNTAILDGKYGVKYNNAIALMEAGKYVEAISVFETLEGYKDSADKIIECNATIFDDKYNDAIALMEAEKYIEAISAFEALEEYKDSVDKITECYKYNVEKLKSAKVGDYVFLGAYEQDNNTLNGKENIEWLVLEVTNGKVLLISRYALERKQFVESHSSTLNTWQTCTLRKWLNSTFINAAFSETEKAFIPTVTVSADTNPQYNTDSGEATQDRVFLLSITEANKYFSSDSARQCKPTDYIVANGVYVDSNNGNCLWWLRTTGSSETRALLVGADGNIGTTGGATHLYSAVRPALWIDLNN